MFKIFYFDEKVKELDCTAVYRNLDFYDVFVDTLDEIKGRIVNPLKVTFSEDGKKLFDMGFEKNGDMITISFKGSRITEIPA